MSRNFCEHIYIIREREFVRLDEPIYKIGRTVNIHNRMNSYPKDSEIYLFEPVTNSIWYERELLRMFSNIYPRGRLRSGEIIGKEYFVGDVNDMILNVRQFIINHYPGRVGTFANCGNGGAFGNVVSSVEVGSDYSNYYTDSEMNSFIDDEDDNTNQYRNDDPYVNEINYTHQNYTEDETFTSSTDQYLSEETETKTDDYSIARCRPRRVIRSTHLDMYKYM